MRIHHLGLAAIGPFPGRHDIDLDELSAGGLFLLEGPTGAGKSTLIDAITYGLYGTLGSTQLDERLPSAHAPQSEPVIEIVFSTAAGIFRVRRTPPYDRPKRRGEGTVRQNASARLWRLSSVEDEAGEALSASTQEVGTEIRGLVGLDRAQFSQTVVLPQGRFATFLRARPEDRAQVLQEVFGTAVYQRVQAELAELARGAKRSLDAARRDLTTAVATFTSLLTDEDTQAALTDAGDSLDTEALDRLSAAVLTTLEEQSRGAELTRKQSAAAERTAQRALEAEQALAQAVERRRALLTRRDQLTAQEPVVVAQRDRLAAGRRAATTAAALRAADTATERLIRAEKTLSRVQAEAADGPHTDLLEHTDPAALRELLAALTAEQGALAEPHRLESGLAARAAGLERAEAELATQRTALTEQQAVLAERPQRSATLGEALSELRRTATPVAAAEAAATERQRIHRAAVLAEQYAAELTGAEHAVALAGLAATEALAHENVVRLRWINSMAGNLATTLRPGDSCPVCGSIEHPEPATETPDHAGLEDVDAATERRARADEGLTTAQTRRSAASERLAAQRELSGGVSAHDAEQALLRARAEVTTATQVAEQIEHDAAAIATFDAETAALTEQVARAEQTWATSTERLRGSAEQLAADRERCRQAAGSAGSVAARAAQLDARRALTDRLLQARTDHTGAAEHRATASAALAEALAEAAFDDAAAARAARLTTAELTALEESVEEYSGELAAVRDGLAEPTVAGLTGEEVLDVAGAEQRCEAARSVLATATRAAATATGNLEQATRARGALLDVVARHTQVSTDAAPVVRMSELAAGGEGNARATNLATYVLLRRFEDVVAAANDRLTIMSAGRFELLRKDTREGRARRAGLGLEVRDHHTETNRDPHTLSGGETFYVSLCLALGLADVVTSEAGGIALDTLFIDEGFGSLDQHTLDGVLGELTRLQAGGRVVGIVSHVTELKDRIPERIEVRPTAGGGSTLRLRA